MILFELNDCCERIGNFLNNLVLTTISCIIAKESREPDSNQRPIDNHRTLQSTALPTELSRADFKIFEYLI